MPTEYHANMTLADIAIPLDVEIDAGWPAQMVEMADHIGAYNTAKLIEAFGGQQIYIPADPERCKFKTILDAKNTRIICQIYQRNELQLPTGNNVLRRIKRASVIASVRNSDITVREAARICGTARTYMTYLVNHTGEGKSGEPLGRKQPDRRQIDMFSPSSR